MMKKLNEIIIMICLSVFSCFFSAGNADAELVERIVAVVNDEVILLSEFNEALRLSGENIKQVNNKEIIDGMINYILLLEQAKKFSFGRAAGDAAPADSDNVVMNYIDRRIKALIYIPFRDIETYYFVNIQKYDGKGLYDVKNEIEEFLLNRVLEIKIQEHIDQLREEARIRIQLE